MRAIFVSRLSRLADEIVGAAVIRDLMEQLDGKRIARATLALPSDINTTIEEFAKLRADVETLLDADVLKASDLPAGVRKCWGM